ncbi:hypothetical protein Bbelb_186950 [Branchiostoma belcheri]|nr:hypothetical protein Bbelb_186950 [Branchiostoma belcheri]
MPTDRNHFNAAHCNYRQPQKSPGLRTTNNPVSWVPVKNRNQPQSAQNTPRNQPVSTKDASQPVTVSTKDAPQSVTVSSEDAPQPVTVSSEDAPQPVTVSSEDAPQPVTVSSEDAPQPVTVSSEDAPQPTTASAEETPQPSSSAPRQRREPIQPMPLPDGGLPASQLEGQTQDHAEDEPGSLELIHVESEEDAKTLLRPVVQSQPAVLFDVVQTSDHPRNGRATGTHPRVPTSHVVGRQEQNAKLRTYALIKDTFAQEKRPRTSTPLYDETVPMEDLGSYEPENIYNCDETGLFYRALPNGTLAVKSKEVAGTKKAMDRISLLFACNMVGTDKLTPFRQEEEVSGTMSAIQEA